MNWPPRALFQKLCPAGGELHDISAFFSKYGTARATVDMNALIDSDFQKIVDAMNDAAPVEDVTESLDHHGIRNMNYDLGFEAMAGCYGAVDVGSNWHYGAPNAEQAFNCLEENRDAESLQAGEHSDPMKAIREDLSRIEAELQELKRTVETALEIYGQRITNTEKYIDELLPWTVEVHGAIEQLTGRVAEAGRAYQDDLSSAQDVSEKD